MGSITRTIANNLTTGLGGQGGVNFRNLIINGDMQIAQRGTSATGLTNGSGGYHTCDRYGFRESGSPSYQFTMSQDSTVPTGQGFGKSLKMDCTTAQGSLAAGDNLRIDQRLEGQQLQHLKKGTANAESVTMSFWVRSSKTGTYIVELIDDNNTRSISKSYTISSADTWEKKTITYDGDTTGALTNNNSTSIKCNFWLAAGTNYTSGTLATSWASLTDANRAVGQVNLADSTSNIWYITGIQLEVGSSATDFEALPHEIQQMRCCRYYQKIGINMGQYTFAPSHSDGWSGQAQLGVLHLPHSMRTNATTEYSGSWTGRGALSNDNNCVPGNLQVVSNDGTESGHLYRFSWNANQNSNSLGTGAMYNANAATNDMAFNAEL